MKDIIRLVAVIAMVLMVMSVGAFLVTYYVIGDLSLADQLRTEEPRESLTGPV